jgi:hypothetical protein
LSYGSKVKTYCVSLKNLPIVDEGFVKSNPSDTMYVNSPSTWDPIGYSVAQCLLFLRTPLGVDHGCLITFLFDTFCCYKFPSCFLKLGTSSLATSLCDHVFIWS